MDFGGVYTDFRLVTRLVDLRTGGTLLLGGLVMAVLIVLIIWRRRRLKVARA
jgi:hypothetical protein